MVVGGGGWWFDITIVQRLFIVVHLFFLFGFLLFSPTVYDWKKNELMYNARTHKSTVLSLNACPQVDWSNNHDVLFCTAGIQHLLFWKKKGRGIICKRGTFGISRRKSKKKSKIIILCMDWFSDGTLLCGTSNGQILMWSKGIFKREPSKYPGT